MNLVTIVILAAVCILAEVDTKIEKYYLKKAKAVA